MADDLLNPGCPNLEATLKLLNRWRAVLAPYLRTAVATKIELIEYGYARYYCNVSHYASRRGSVKSDQSSCFMSWRNAVRFCMNLSRFFASRLPFSSCISLSNATRRRSCAGESVPEGERVEDSVAHHGATRPTQGV